MRLPNLRGELTPPESTSTNMTTRKSTPPNDTQSLRNASSALVARARRQPKLTKVEERELLHRWQVHRDQRAANALAERSLRYVVAVAARYRSYKVPMDVLISEGNLGLVRAMDKFDLNQETRFSTYAMYWIRYYVIEHIMKSWSVVGGGTGALKTRTFFRLRRERARAWSQFGEGEAAEQALAERLNMTRRRVARLTRQIDQRDVSLNVAAYGDSSVTLMDTLATDAQQHHDVERVQALERFKPVLDEAISGLSERERLILHKRLMAESEDEESLSSLGVTLSVSRERVRQLEEALKRKLRSFINQQLPNHEYSGAYA